MARGILGSQQAILKATNDALVGLRATGAGLHVSVDQLNITLATNTDAPRRVVFEWDEQAGEYAWRNAGD